MSQHQCSLCLRSHCICNDCAADLIIEPAAAKTMTITGGPIRCARITPVAVIACISTTTIPTNRTTTQFNSHSHNPPAHRIKFSLGKIAVQGPLIRLKILKVVSVFHIIISKEYDYPKAPLANLNLRMNPNVLINLIHVPP